MAESGVVDVPAAVLEAKDVRRGGGRTTRGRRETTWEPLPAGFCYYFANGLRCKFGEACKYTHAFPGTAPKLSARGQGSSRGRFHSGAYRGRGATRPVARLNPDAVPFVPSTEAAAHLPPQPEEEEPKESKAKPRRRQPKKRTGGRVEKKEEVEEGEGKEKEPAPYAPYRNERRPTGNPRKGLRLKRTVVTDETLKELKDRELEYLQRRYPKCVEISDLAEGRAGFALDFVPTDPDWAFDVRSLRLSLVFPPEYPLNAFSARLDEPEEGSQGQLPPILAAHIDKAMGAWAAESKASQEDKGIVEGHLRSFFLWLDRGLESLFIQGLKLVRMDMQARQSGISFVDHAKYRDGSGREVEADLEALDLEDDSDPEDSDDVTAEDSSSSEEEAEVGCGGAGLELRPGEVEIRAKAEWSSTVAAVSLRKLSLLLGCLRCHAKKEAPVLGGLKPGATVEPQFNGGCDNCGLAMRGSARALISHEHSRQLGAVALEGCVAIDLILLASELAVTCLACDKELVVKGLSYGELNRTWCNDCNRRLEIRLDAVRFHTPAPLDQAALLKEGGGHTVKREKRAPKDGRIKEGLPLPDNGTCKHYKKSFRWFRFPCCGKIYPCDVCHEEGETHEMKLANRILCGFCAKEQPYVGTKGCIGCGGAVVATRTKHWEGGKGCRNTRLMSNNDKQKFVGKNKTMSNHQKELLKSKKKKKKTTSA